MNNYLFFVSIMTIIAAFFPSENIPRWFDGVMLFLGVLTCMGWAYIKGAE